jgi:L-iditol 2-dehydrogenase
VIASRSSPVFLATPARCVSGGRYNGCERVLFRSTLPVPGLLRRYIAHPAVWCHKLPLTHTFKDGALPEPLSVALAPWNTQICVLGDAALDRLVSRRCSVRTQPVRIRSSSQISTLGVSRSPSRSFLLSSSDGPARVRTLLVVPREAKEVLAARIVDAMGGTKPDVALACTVAESPIGVAIEAVQFGGMTSPSMRMLTREVDIRLQYRYANEAGVLSDVRKLVTHQFAIEESVHASTTSADPKSGAIKVRITNLGL